MSTLYFSSVTNKAPETSPSEINLIFTLSSFNSLIICLCLGLSNIQAVRFSGFLLRYSLKFKIFFFLKKTKSKKIFYFFLVLNLYI